MYKLIPQHMQDGLTLWVEKGVMTGHFMTAVMENDLMEAYGRADEQNQWSMRNWCVFLYSYAPRGCYGSRANVAEWRKVGGLEGYAKAAEIIEVGND